MSNTSFNQFFTAEYSLGLLNLREAAQAQELFGSSFDAVVSALKWEDRFLALADQLPAVEPSARLLLQVQTALGHETTVPLRPSAAAAGTTARPPTTAAPDAATTAIRGADRLPRHGADQGKSRNASDADLPRRPRTRLWLVIAIVAIVVLAALFVATITMRPTAKVETVVSVPVAATSASGKASSSQATPAPTIAAESTHTTTPSTPPAPPSALPSTQPGQPEPPASISPVLPATPALLTSPPMSEAPAPGSTPHTTLAAILQAPGQTSTPGWIVTFDPAGDLVLTPKVKIDIPANAVVYLWTHADTEAPRLLAELNPNHAAMVSKTVAGSLPAGQLFEITQETRTATPPKAPKGPILFIGRLVALQ
ncbi:MAG: anti-sigma factor [Burkholderiaceae bacterium]|nr:MAG: anti-sigma factor [Burkholderiaceae bacterium]TAM03546.1 MAG: anti-sigma factor [Pusillimonas sp.]